MRHRSSRPRHGRLAAVCLVLFGALVAGGFHMVALDEGQQRLGEDQLVFAQAATVRARLEDELYGSLNLASGLQAYVTAHPGLGDPERLDVLLTSLRDQGHHLRNVGLAPDNVVAMVHPLEGNEAALGLHYRDVPEQWDSVRHAMTTRAMVLNGPVDLVQGGRGLVNRTPVFLPDGSYWGVISLVIDVDSLLETVRGDLDLDIPIDWAVRAWSNYADTTSVTGDPALFDDHQVRLTFDVPDGTWELVASPASPSAAPGRRALVLRAVTVLFAAVVTALVFAVVVERRRIVALSLHDPLTGLANRRLLDERIDRAAAWADRSGSEFVVAFLDLDHFKRTNDSHGHRAGDHVLREVARRLESRVRATDTVARVGGDEFVLLLPDTSSDDLADLLARVEAAIREPITWGNQQLQVDTSVGTAVYPVDGRDATELLRHADEWMYRAKQVRHGDAPVPTS